MHSTIDLDGYLHRVGYRAPVAADLSTLRALAAAHAQAIAFENLDPWLGCAVDLELATLQRKLLRDGRGGYCFEQNLLFQAALQAIGFRVSGLIARVLWRQPDDAVTPQTHMLLRVALEGQSWVVDVGFGSQTLTGALHLQPDIEQPTRHEPFRLVQTGGDWRMQSLIAGQWRSLYHFDLHSPRPVDYVVANHYVSTFPGSRFTQNLVAARVDGECRLTLLNREFSVRRAGHETEHHELQSGDEIRHVLEQRFLLRLPKHPELDRRLGSLTI